MEPEGERTAKLLSLILYPELLITLLLLMVFLFLDDSLEALIVSFILLCLMQTLAKSSLFMKSKEREDRIAAYIVTMISYAVHLAIASCLFAGTAYHFIAICFFSGCMVMAIANAKKKVSVHCGTVALVSSVASVLFFPAGLVSLFLIPLIVWIRVTGKFHELDEAIIGSLIGLVIPISITIITNAV